ncbi:MAG: hypothetical protein JWM68_833 [Verrucomicrobiales bacterium]|nr:hypothetical protein [Verrucomicrobiales bacterium]
MVRVLSALFSLCFLSLTLGVAAPCLSRTNNNSLRLPDSLDSLDYTTLPAFPGLKFDSPVAIASPMGETDRLFVLERTGSICVITNLKAPNRSVFLDLTDRVSHKTMESGLLGLAFHPGYRTNGFLYVFFTSATDGGRDCIARFSVDPKNPNKALPGSYTEILFQPDTTVNHNAGDLHFGPDGYLYISLGDPFSRAQELFTFFSGILRIDVDRKPGNLAPNPGLGVSTNYRVPADNPFIGTMFKGVPPVRTEFWASGLRNPWRFSFDSLTGDLYCGDVGQGIWEEVNIIKKGKNYGWNLAEGPSTNVLFESPIYAYEHKLGLAIVGGVVYRGSQNPDLYGSYVFGDYVSGRIWGLHYTNGVTSGVRELCNYPSTTCFGIDPQSGDILLAIADGTLRRLTHRTAPTAQPIPSLLSETGAFTDLTNLITHPGIEPYDVTVPFWSDNAEKRRWFMVPASKTIDFKARENWQFPNGTTFIKHFDLETIAGDPSSKRKIETRFLVMTDDGAYGLSYFWDDTQTNAFLVPDAGMTKDILITAGDVIKTQQWIYPSRTQCLTCHTRHSGFALGFNTQQLNRNIWCGSNSVNQLEALSDAGYFLKRVTDLRLLPTLASLSDTNNSLAFRARSYLAANCAHCHQGVDWGFGNWDARFDTSMTNSSSIASRLLAIDQLSRMHRKDFGRMPPLGSSILDNSGIKLIRDWTVSLPRFDTDEEEESNSIGSLLAGTGGVFGLSLWLARNMIFKRKRNRSTSLD